MDFDNPIQPTSLLEPAIFAAAAMQVLIPKSHAAGLEMAVKNGAVWQPKMGPVWGGLLRGSEMLWYAVFTRTRTVSEEPKVLKMIDFELVRRLVLVEGLSQKEVAKKLNKSRRSIQMALLNSEPGTYTRFWRAIRKG